MALVGFVLFFIGIILVICYPYNKKKNARCSAQTQGVLSGIRPRFNSEGSLKDAHIYTYYVDGVQYQLETVDYSLNDSTVGNSYPIWYNPAKPEDAQAFHGSDKYLKNMLIIGLVLLLVGIVVTFIGLIM